MECSAPTRFLNFRRRSLAVQTQPAGGERHGSRGHPFSFLHSAIDSRRSSRYFPMANEDVRISKQPRKQTELLRYCAVRLDSPVSTLFGEWRVAGSRTLATKVSGSFEISLSGGIAVALLGRTWCLCGACCPRSKTTDLL